MTEQLLKLSPGTCTSSTSSHNHIRPYLRRKFSQESTNALQQTLVGLRARHAATVQSLESQVSLIHHDLAIEHAAHEEAQQLLAEECAESLYQHDSRRREVRLRLISIDQMRRILEGLRRLAGKYKPAFQQLSEHSNHNAYALMSSLMDDLEQLRMDFGDLEGTHASVLHNYLEQLRQPNLPSPEIPARELVVTDIAADGTDHASRIGKAASLHSWEAREHPVDQDIDTSYEKSVDALMKSEAQPVVETSCILESSPVLATVSPVSGTIYSPEGSSMIAPEVGASPVYSKNHEEDNQSSVSTNNFLSTEPPTPETPADVYGISHPADVSADHASPEVYEEPVTRDAHAFAINSTLSIIEKQPLEVPTAFEPMRDKAKPAELPSIREPVEEMIALRSDEDSQRRPAVEIDLPTPPAPKAENDIHDPEILTIEETNRVDQCTKEPPSLIDRLANVTSRYDGLQKSLSACSSAISKLKGAFDALNPPTLESMLGSPASQQLHMVLDRLDDYNEDARVEMEIGIADEAKVAQGLMAIVSLSSSNMEPSFENDAEVFLSVDNPQFDSLTNTIRQKIDDVKHDIGVLQEQLHRIIESNASSEDVVEAQANGWASWASGVLSPVSSRPSSPSPTISFGAVMSSRASRQNLYPGLGVNNSTSDFSKLGLRISSPTLLQSHSPSQLLASPRLPSPGYFFPINRSSSLGLGISRSFSSFSRPSISSPQTPQFSRTAMSMESTGVETDVGDSDVE